VVQLLLAFVVIALDGGLFESSVHSFDLPLGPWMVGLGEPMLDAVLSAGAVERMTAPHRGGFRGVFGRSVNWVPLSVKTERTL